jgi:hypothetical protein
LLLFVAVAGIWFFVATVRRRARRLRGERSTPPSGIAPLRAVDGRGRRS